MIEGVQLELPLDKSRQLELPLEDYSSIPKEKDNNQNEASTPKARF
jgi:hypothetical protein